MKSQLTCPLLSFSKLWIVAQIAMWASSPVHIATTKYKENTNSELQIHNSNAINQALNHSKLLK